MVKILVGDRAVNNAIRQLNIHKIYGPKETHADFIKYCTNYHLVKPSNRV